ncbi:MAG: hypothetical protein ACRD8O_15930 [Bryobacteraceae bacterium]
MSRIDPTKPRLPAVPGPDQTGQPQTAIPTGERFGDIAQRLGTTQSCAGQPATSQEPVTTADTESLLRKSQMQTPRAIPKYDPAAGPQITNDMWTMEMLTGEMPADLLRNMVDPAGFMNARKALLERPTEAKSISLMDGSSTPLSAAHMSTRAQADAMAARLAELGAADLTVAQRPPATGLFRIDYGNDDRRHFHVGDFNVGMLATRYAMYPKEVADQMTRDELRAAKPTT